MRKGCLWAMIVGFLRLNWPAFAWVWTHMVTLGTTYPEGSFLWIINNIQFQYFSILITLISALVMVVVSYATEQPQLRRHCGLDLRHRHR